jgi:hypothetical protein
VAPVIERVFGVRYHPAQVCRLLRAVGWSPRSRSAGRASAMRPPSELGLEEQWSALERRRKRRGARSSGWTSPASTSCPPRSGPTPGRPDAGPARHGPDLRPVGRTPVLTVPLTRDHLSAISAITPDGRLFLMVQEDPIRSPDVVRFLRHLVSHLPAPLLVIWDHSRPTARSRSATSSPPPAPRASAWSGRPPTRPS